MPAVPELEAEELEEVEVEITPPPKYALAEEAARNLASAKRTWAPLANCWDMSPQDMFPNTVVKETAVARNVCKGCPVMLECLNLALVGRETFGVWGGRTSRELNTIYRLLKPEYGDMWAQFDDGAAEVLFKYATDLCDNYDEEHGVDREEVARTKRERLDSMQDRLAKLRL